MKRTLLLILVFVLAPLSAMAQEASLKLVLCEKGGGEPVGFATVSLTLKGQSKPVKYMLSDSDGKVLFENLKKGTYVVKAEMMGYQTFTKEMQISSAVDLGKVEMATDNVQLDAASVSAVGNPIVIKKDTIEYNASSFKTADNDVLEDLLKKLPGVEVADDGSITVNGETVKKITIDGKTFFLDDPQLASKNIPAKMIEKLKVIQKKSDQAAFSGIDDGEEEQVIDLTVKKGMMKGFFGNVSGGVGHDIPSDQTGDWRYQAAGFLGRFTDKSQISVILNGNNTNNRGFDDLSGTMMGNMRQGRRRGSSSGSSSKGITTSYMAGINGAWTLVDGKMDLGGNYLYNHSDNNVQDLGLKTTYLDDKDLKYYSNGLSNTQSGGNRFGVRLEHKFSDNTILLFEPQVNFGNGYYSEVSRDSTYSDNRAGTLEKLNYARANNAGSNENVSTSGFLLLRQRLGIPGRTLTAMVRYNVSCNKLWGYNTSQTADYSSGTPVVTDVNQNFTTNSNSYGVTGRLTYTEPLGGNFYAEGNYTYAWTRSDSDKETTDGNTGERALNYCNTVVNNGNEHTMGVNGMYQKDKFRAQLGVSAIANITRNETKVYDKSKAEFVPYVYDPGTLWNWSPQAMVWGEIGEKWNLRLFYRGSTNQPSVNKLMPVPDVSDPLDMSFGNPNLNPYFQHGVRGHARYSDKQTFTSFNINLRGNIIQDPIVNATWYGKNGGQYSMPYNGPTSTNFSINTFVNSPIAKSSFSVANNLRASYSNTASYVGSNIDMSTLPDPTEDYYGFINEFLKRYPDLSASSDFAENRTRTLNIFEQLKFTYRINSIEVSVAGQTNYNQSWYTISTMADKTAIFNSQATAAVIWTWNLTGMTFKGDFNYKWYNGYTVPQSSEYILNAEIQKLLFKKKFTLALKCYDILGQSKTLTVTDTGNYHQESRSNTLGRYIILSLTYRFGNMDKSKAGGRRPPMGGPPPM